MASNLFRKAGNIFDKITRFTFILGYIFIAYMMLSVALEVVTRYFLNRSQGWIIETVEYSLVWIPFLGAAWILRKDEHVKMDFFKNWVSPRTWAVINVVTSILGAISFFIITWYGTQVTISLFESGELMTTLLKPLKAPLYIIVPIGSLLLFIQFLRRIFGYILEAREPTIPEDKLPHESEM